MSLHTAYSKQSTMNQSIELELHPEEFSTGSNSSFTNKIGKCYVFLYKNGSPLIVIGPDCKLILIICLNIYHYNPSLVLYCSKYNHFYFLPFSTNNKKGHCTFY